ncbi:hypothetical protein [Marinomonas epiphytica]
MSKYLHQRLAIRFIFSFGCFVFPIMTSADQQAFPEVEGLAYDIDTGELLYKESYYELGLNRFDVLYRDDEGKLFARKQLDFSRSATTPKMTQINELANEKIEVEVVDNQVRINYTSKGKPKEAMLPLTPGTVIDAGFDAMLKKHWQNLLLGGTLEVDFLVPSRLNSYGFKLKQKDCLEAINNSSACFSLTANSWLIRLAVDPIVLTYDLVFKRLIRFTGRSNISNEQGEYLNVDIYYQYPNEP